MADIVITNDFVRALTKGIRSKYGTEPKHTEVMDLVASALGWKTDALMHKLKGKSSDVSPDRFEAPEDMDEKVMFDWIVRKRWRRTLRSLTVTLDNRILGDDYPMEEGRGHAALMQLALGDPDGALRFIGDDIEGAWPCLVKGLATYKVYGDIPEARSLIAKAFNEDSRLLEALTVRRAVRDRPIYPAPNSFSLLDPYGMLREYVEFFPTGDLVDFVESTASDAGIKGFKTPAVPISESVTDDHIVCLFDGAKRKMLSRYLRTEYGMTVEEYRSYWGLPDEYPMTAPGYQKEKRVVAEMRGIRPSESD